MPIIKCPFNDCDYATPNESSDIVCTLLNIHKMIHEQQPGPSHQEAISSAPKLNRPFVDMGIDQETWLAFIRRWETFRIGSNISEGVAAIQLFQCASDKLGDMMLKADSKLMMKPLSEVSALMESIAVIKVAIGVKRAELTSMSQDYDEPFRTFATRVRGKAETCNFTTTRTCPCSRQNIASYTEEAIKDVMLAGIADDDIRREALGTEDILSKSVNNIISFVENKEMGRKATESSSVAAVSSFKRQKKGAQGQIDDRSAQVSCESCKKLFFPFRNKKGGRNSKPFKYCLTCWRNKRSNAVQSLESTNDADLVQQDLQVSSLHVSTNNIMLTSKIFDKKSLRKAKIAGLP